MKGDYSRNTFDPNKHFSRVLMQQGRVQVDADWNEQASILLHYLRSMAVDLIGPYGGPTGRLGFAVQVKANKLDDLFIGGGHYYVDGILCESEGGSYYHQPDYPLDPKKKESDKLPDQLPFLVYLDVWERHITAIEDPGIQEVALGGPDTAARTKVVWQVRVATRGDVPLLGPADLDPLTIGCVGFEQTNLWTKLKETLQPANRGKMAAKAQEPDDADAKEVCIVSPDARYRGAENQLYRVEIHKGGNIGTATFKWSRENGAVVFPIQLVAENSVTLENLGRDDRFGLEVGDWVEVVDNNYVGRGRTEDLLRVTDIEPVDRLVTLSDAPAYGHDQDARPLLRRWDQQQANPNSKDLKDSGGAVLISEGDWISLEDGIQIKFEGGNYRSGDYWLIPARTETGNIEWPKADEEPLSLRPRGVTHHYAPLVLVFLEAATATKPATFNTTDLRHSFLPYGSCCPKISIINPPTVKQSARISFVARIGRGEDTDFTYHWIVAGGTINGPTDKSSIEVDAPSAVGSVVATVVVEGLPPGCPNTAMSACQVE